MAEFAAARLLLFRVAELTCATEVSAVVEILPVSPTTRIPGAPQEVSGLINVRGSLITLVDGRRSLGQPAGEEGRSVVLLETGARTIGFSVDEVLDLVSIGEGEMAGRDDLPGVESRFVKGVAHHGEDNFVVLDTDALIDWVLPT
jgi:purine-binding chemotaxis protein CheW